MKRALKMCLYCLRSTFNGKLVFAKWISICNIQLSNTTQGVFLTFELGGDVACTWETPDPTVPDCSGATPTRTLILILQQTKVEHELMCVAEDTLIFYDKWLPRLEKYDMNLNI